MRRTSKVDWTESATGKARYHERRAEAQRRANETGFDHGLSRNDVFKDFMICMLPMKANRYGRDLQCEVVSCEDITRCQKGHGP